MRTRIFATPSEPHFNLDSHCLSPNLLEESLNILAEENDKLIDAAENSICCFKDGRPVGKPINYFKLVMSLLLSGLQQI